MGGLSMSAIVDGAVVRALESLGPDVAMDREARMAVGPVSTQWVAALGYTQYLVKSVAVDPESMVPVPIGSRDRSLGPLVKAIRNALSSLAADVAGSTWWGKEREAISLFAFSHLMRECHPGTALFDPGQIGIEVRVKQTPKPVPSKELVTKDIVIWPKPRMTVWNEERRPVNWPLAVLEWKVRRAPEPEPLVSFTDDLKWLRDYTGIHQYALGFCVSVGVWNPLPNSRRVDVLCVKVEKGKEGRPWNLRRSRRAEP
jgi:hypothetical protein